MKSVISITFQGPGHIAAAAQAPNEQRQQATTFGAMLWPSLFSLRRVGE